MYSRFSKALVLSLSPWGLYFLYLWPAVFYRTSKGIATTSSGIWADWSAHFAYAHVFAFRSPSHWFDHHPLFYLGKFNYPFMSAIIPGLLIRWGADLITAFLLPSIATSLILLYAFNLLAQQILKSQLLSFVSSSLFLAGGGMGFVVFFSDLIHGNMLQVLAHPPLEYTALREKNIEFINIVTSELLPQRAFLLGIPLTLFFISKLFCWYEESFQFVSQKKLVLFGALSSLLLITHSHSFIAFAIVCLVFSLCQLKNIRSWFTIAVSAAIPTFFLYRFFHGERVPNGFFTWLPGWMSHSSEKGGSFFLFWWFNWGFFLPLAFYATWKERFYKNPLVLSGWVLFVLCNLLKFQPYTWDNTKLLTWSYCFLTFPVACYLGRLWNRPDFFSKGISVLLFIVLTASSTLDLWRISRSRAHQEFQMWSNEEIQIAKHFREISSPDDLVLTATEPHNWVSTLAGRPILMGYPGHLWTYGILYQNVEQDLKTMFQGKEKASSLFSKYGIKFAVIDLHALKTFEANEGYFQKNFSKTLETPHYRIYKLDVTP